MKNFAKAAILATSLVTATVAAAQAENRRDDYGFGEHRYGSFYGHPGKFDVSLRLNREFRNDVISLRRLLHLDGRYRGYEIRRIVIELKPSKRTRRISLISDGHMVDSEKASNERRVVLKPDDDQRRGRAVRYLQLKIKGRAYIRSITARLKTPKHHGRGRHVKNRRGAEIDNSPTAYTKFAAEILRILINQEGR